MSTFSRDERTFLNKVRQDLLSPYDLLKGIDDKLLYLALRPSGGEESPLIEQIQEEYGSTDYQRLEFLGDCVLEMVVRLNLFNRFYLASLHEIHQVKQALVNNQTLACFSNRLGLCFGDIGSVAPESAKVGAKNQPFGGGKVCADYLEAIIGAIYIHLQYKETPDAIREIGDWLNEVVHLDIVIDALLFGQGDEPEDEFHACIAPRFREKITKR